MNQKKTLKSFLKKAKTAKRLAQVTGVCAACFFSMQAKAQNPFLPLWEFIPDGEPYVFEDPDKPGQMRVYVYGSHDSIIKDYCGLEQVVWSASVDDLTQWRYDGVIFRNVYDRDGNYVNADKKGDLLFAPDVAVRTESDGSKTYYLYPNVQNGGRQGLVAKSKRPDGPFEVCNWSTTNPRETDGVLTFDPAVFVDDDGRVYGYWGFKESICAELDPKTMATVKPGTKVKRDMVSNLNQPGVFRFFEASSIRKIEDKYVFIYSRWTEEGENGLPGTNYTLGYAYSDSPMGPFTYGGTIIDGRARKTLADGTTIPTATHDGNTHGSIFKAGNQWWIVYHRHTGLDEYSRQAMVAPIDVKVQKGRGGKVTISEGEYTSEGFQTEGLNPLHRTMAAWACYYTGNKVGTHEWPNFEYSGSYIQAVRDTTHYGLATASSTELYQSASAPLGGLRRDHGVNCPVVNNNAGSTVGFKYFNMDKMKQMQKASLSLHYKPLGVKGSMKIYLSAPTEKEGGILIGQMEFSGNDAQQATEVSIPLKNWQKAKGKHALYFVFDSPTPSRSLCDLYDFIIK